jgi:hypothetical protein
MRLTDFESRRVDELAPATLASYKTKAGAAATAADAAGDTKTADRRFSGIVKATKKQFDQDAKGVSEDNLYGGRPDDEVKFFIDSEPAYYAVMDRFGDHIEFRGDDMVAPLRLWGAIQQTAGDAGGAADIAGLEDEPMWVGDELDEQGMSTGSLNEARDARIKRIQELSEGLSMNDLAKVPMFVVDSFKKAAFATEREAIETKNAIKTVFNWSQSTPQQKQAAKKQMHDIAKIAAGLAIAGAVGHVGAAALGVGHAATTVGAVAQTAIEHIIADLGIEAVAGILGAGGINIVKNALHDITTSSGHEFEKQQYQQGVKQRIKTQPMAGPAGHLPEQTVAEDALAGMKKLAGIASVTTQTTPGQRQYRHMPTAVQPR